MSGGFFRGTSADQDTRFSNKQAKLLKTQKFAAELDYPVDMTKVKIDVIKPWIATRATELLGFEDEVLINFVYGLLDGKEVDGKQIQIQLTGFLEKNTGKFMKELWVLLLSAQNNASGVPQQFLDAKQEEMKNRKVESDRITQEIQKRKEKEGREIEQERLKRMDVEAGNSRSANAVSGSSSRHSLPRDSRVQSDKEREMEEVHNPRLKGREGRPRSVSVSSESREHSISPSRQYHSPRRSRSSERRYKSPIRRSVSPRRRYSPPRNWSPSRHRSPYARRRSPSTPRHRSPSLARRRSPYGRRSPSSLRRRSSPSRRRSPLQSRRGSPSPLHHRRSPSPGRRRLSPSPTRHRRSPSRRRRSPSPLRRRRSPSPTRHRRSPMRRRVSPSPTRRRISPPPTRRRISPSPSHRRMSPPARRRTSPSPARWRTSPSPARRRSPIRHSSLSPARHRSLSPSRSSPYRSPHLQRNSPMHSPTNYGADSQISPQANNRNHSPYRISSPSYPARRDSSRETDSRSNGFRSKKQQQESVSERDSEKRSLVHDALHREVADRSGSTRGADHVPRQRPVPSRSSSHDSKDQIDNDCSIQSEHSSEWSGSPSHLRTINSGRNRLSESTAKQTGKRMPHDMSGMNDYDEQAGLVRSRAYHKTDSSPKKGTQGHPSNMVSKKESEQKSETDLTKRHSGQVSESPNDMEYGLGVHSEKQPKLRSDAYRDSHHGADSVKKSKRKIDLSSHSDSEETDTRKYKSTERKRHKKSDKHRRFSDGTSESDSDIEEKKEAKRRRKDERRLRKEEKRRRREEKHRKKLERHGAKHKLKSMDTVTPLSDLENQNLDDAGRSDAEPADSEEKKLEIQLREKALESLRVRKGIRH